MPCNCTTGMNAKLAGHNTRLVETFGFPRDGRPAYTRPKIDTEKIEPRKRVGPALAIPSFCPFCGEPYEPQPAKPAIASKRGLAYSIRSILHGLRDAIDMNRHIVDSTGYGANAPLAQEELEDHRSKWAQASAAADDETMHRLHELEVRFRTAAASIPYVAEALEKGHQFNVYERAGEDDDEDLDDEFREYKLCIGPISDARLLADVDGRAMADLFEAAFKIAALVAPLPPVETGK